MSLPETFLRQLDFFDPIMFDGSVTIIGLGSIGSCVALAYTKMGITNFELYDYDRVVPHNKPNQLYFDEHVGSLKVRAAREMMLKYAPMDDVIIVTHDEMFNSETRIDSRVVVIAVDSREARLDIWEAIKACPSVEHLIDARMGGESLGVYNVVMGNEESMEKYVASFEGEGTELPCTGQSIIYNLFAVTAFVGSSLRKFVAGEDIPSRVLHDTRNWMTVLSR